MQVHITDGACIRIGWKEYSLDNVTVGMLHNNPHMRLELPEGRLLSVVRGVDHFPTINQHIVIPAKSDYMVRCSNRGAEWYIDGMLVAETQEQSRLLPGLQPYIYAYGGIASFQLVHVEYEQDE